MNCRWMRYGSNGKLKLFDSITFQRQLDQAFRCYVDGMTQVKAEGRCQNRYDALSKV